MRPATIAVLLVAATASAQTPRDRAPQDATPVFGASTEAVHLDVFVSRDGQPVPELTAADFEVLDGGVAQAVEVVSLDEVPTLALLVLDTSASVAGERLAELKTAAQAFVRGLRPDDRAGLLVFNHRARLAVPPASDKVAVLDAIAAARAEGGTSLHDAVFFALALADAGEGRPVIVVFSDGADRLSWLEDEQLAEAARQSDAVVYTVGAWEPGTRLQGTLLRETAYARRNGIVEGPPEQGQRSRRLEPIAPTVLRTIASATGGQIWSAPGGNLERAFLDVLSQVRSRYVLRYAPAGARRPGWHPVEVRVRNQRGAEVRVRKGYFQR